MRPKAMGRPEIMAMLLEQARARLERRCASRAGFDSTSGQRRRERDENFWRRQSPAALVRLTRNRSRLR